MRNKTDQRYFEGDVIQIENKTYKVTSAVREREEGRGRRVKWWYRVEQVSGPKEGPFKVFFWDYKVSYHQIEMYPIITPSEERLFR